jgi:ankyrin repeat protein
LATEFLLQHGASVALEDEEGKTPLDYARTAGSKRVLARLQGAANKKAAASAAAASVSSPHAVSPSVASPH